MTVWGTHKEKASYLPRHRQEQNFRTQIEQFEV